MADTLELVCAIEGRQAGITRKLDVNTIAELLQNDGRFNQERRQGGEA